MSEQEEGTSAAAQLPTEEVQVEAPPEPEATQEQEQPPPTEPTPQQEDKLQTQETPAQEPPPAPKPAPKPAPEFRVVKSGYIQRQGEQCYTSTSGRL